MFSEACILFFKENDLVDTTATMMSTTTLVVVVECVNRITRATYQKSIT